MHKFEARVAAIAEANPAVEVAAALYTIRAPPVLGYLAQLSSPLPLAAEVERRAVQRIWHLPSNALPQHAHLEFSGVGCPRLPSPLWASQRLGLCSTPSRLGHKVLPSCAAPLHILRRSSNLPRTKPTRMLGTPFLVRRCSAMPRPALRRSAAPRRLRRLGNVDPTPGCESAGGAPGPAIDCRAVATRLARLGVDLEVPTMSAVWDAIAPILRKERGVVALS